MRIRSCPSQAQLLCQAAQHARVLHWSRLMCSVPLVSTKAIGCTKPVVSDTTPSGTAGRHRSFGICNKYYVFLISPFSALQLHVYAGSPSLRHSAEANDYLLSAWLAFGARNLSFLPCIKTSSVLRCLCSCGGVPTGDGPRQTPHNFPLLVREVSCLTPSAASRSCCARCRV